MSSVFVFVSAVVAGADWRTCECNEVLYGSASARKINRTSSHSHVHQSDAALLLLLVSFHVFICARCCQKHSSSEINVIWIALNLEVFKNKL